MTVAAIRLALGLACLTPRLGAQEVEVSGELKRWHKITVTLAGPAASESGAPNPFTDRRMEVTFTHPASGRRYVVPGYFAADGDAANTSATAGSRWRAHLCPDETGRWRYRISFRAGARVALSDSPTAGVALAPFDGIEGEFVIAETDKSGRDHRAKGRLEYVGRHHLRFAGTGEYFLKAGADAPENFLAYEDFDNTPDHGGRRKRWAAHVQDWRPGDPTWKDGLGKGIIGAVNYLADKGCNVISFLTYNHHGDDKNVFPYVDPDDPLRLDCSKLDQWEIVFTQMDRRGVYLHFKTQETENDQDLDGGALGDERRLYYRELIARFGHHLALNWNLGEENTNTTAQEKAFAQFFDDHDPYRHPVVLHTFPGKKDAVYGPLLGNASRLAGVSLQCAPAAVFSDTLEWVTRSAAAGRPWVVANDEQGPANSGILPDADDPTHNAVRHQVLWGNLMAGGAGIESYFGYKYPNSDLTCEDYRSRDLWWDQCRHALTFFTENEVPFWEMSNHDERVSGATAWCLAGAGQFVVYLPDGGAGARLDLGDQTGFFDVLWYDPRNGGPLQTATIDHVPGGGARGLGAPPTHPNMDWAVLVRPAAGVSVNAGPDQTLTLDPGLTEARVTLEGDVALHGEELLGLGWTVVSSPGTAAFSDPGSPRTEVLLRGLGRHVLRLTARSKTDAATDTVTVELRAFVPEVTLQLTPTADAYLEDGNGFDNALLKAEPGRRVSYLKFDLSGLPAGATVQSALLRLAQREDTGQGTLRLQRGTHSNWPESGLTDANAPAAVGTGVTRSGSVGNGAEVSFDVAPLLPDGGLVTFVLSLDAGGNDIWFGSRESDAPPRLDIRVTTPVPEPPPLRVRVDAGGLFLDWDAARFVLQHASELPGPWRDLLPSPTPPYRPVTSAPAGFYRLRWHPTGP